MSALTTLCLDMGIGVLRRMSRESSAYFLATNPVDPKLIYAAATLGQIYRSTDGGESWRVLKRRLGEIRALAWLPD